MRRWFLAKGLDKLLRDEVEYKLEVLKRFVLDPEPVEWEPGRRPAPAQAE